MTEAVHLAEEAMRNADALEEANDIDGAINAMSLAVEIEPESIKYRGLRGRLFALQRKWRAAIRDFDSVLAKKPNAPTILYGRGRARSMIDDLDGALADFEQCIALQPSSADAYVQIGDIHYYRGELQRALAAYNKAVEIDPSRQAEVEVSVSEIEAKLKNGV